MKAAIVVCSYEMAVYLKIGKVRLPQGVRFSSMRECFDRAGCCEVRVEGDGILDTRTGEILPRCDLVELPGGATELVGPWKFAAPVPEGAVSLTENASA